MKEIKDLWEVLPQKDKDDYHRKAEHVEVKLKAKKFRS